MIIFIDLNKFFIFLRSNLFSLLGLSWWQDVIKILRGEYYTKTQSALDNVLTLVGDDFAIVISLHGELEIVLVTLNAWEALRNHLGVGEQDSVKGEASSLDWMLVHFY